MPFWPPRNRANGLSCKSCGLSPQITPPRQAVSVRILPKEEKNTCTTMTIERIRPL